MKNQVFLGLGSNIENRKEYLEKAIKILEDNPDISITAISLVYETVPFGNVEQTSFLNMVIRIETLLNPDELLNATMAIEEALDRVRTIRWGPRTIDIDILLYGNEVINTDNLIVPHPGIRFRAFVLVPLLELAPDIRLPSGELVKDFLEKVSMDVDAIKVFSDDYHL